MRLTVLTAALCAVLAGVVPAQAANSNNADIPAAKAAAAQRLGFDQVSVDRDGRQNALVMSYGSDGKARAGSAKAGAVVLHARSADDVAALFHGELGSLVGMLPGSAMAVRNVKVLADGASYYNLEQSYQGVPVVGDEVTVQIGADGVVQAVFGSAVSIERIGIKPGTNADVVYGAARQAAVRDGALSASIARSAIVLDGAPRLVVLARRGGTPVLAWEAVASTGAGDLEPFRSRVYADANSGRLLDAYTLIHRALSRRIYDSNNVCWNGSGAAPGNQVLAEGGSTAGVIQPAINAYNAFGNVYHYFNNAHGIDSYDDNGSQLKAYVRMRLDLGSGCTGANAAWGNGTMYMGIGNASFNDMSTEPDVTYHEFGHGVTNVTSGLEYHHESGGLNEAASDIYAAAVEAWINTVPGGAANSATPIAYTQSADVWTIGEGLRKNGGGPFRTMRDPATEGDLDRYSQYVSQFGNCVNPSTATNDNCGVHTSSGIANLAFYLLTNGGTHPRGATNVNVGAIPFDRAIKYFFEVNQTRAVGANATFSQMRNAMQARARGNGAVGLCDEVRISQAWAAVEVTGVAPQNANACSGGTNQAPTAAFSTTTSGLTVNVNGGGSSDPDGSIASYAWNFGDGSTGTGATASRTYAAAGTYTVTLTVTDNQGATNTTTRSVTVTSGGNAQCPGDAFSGSFSGATGQSQYRPTAGSYTTTTSGTHTVCLSGPSGTDFDVYLQKRSTSGTWSNVAKSEGTTSTERFTYSGTAGTYRVRVTNYSGTGAYTGTLQKP